MRRAGVECALLGVAGLILTWMIATVPHMYFAYRAQISRSVLETVVSLVAALLAVLCVGRYRRYRRPGDLGVVYAMALLAMTYPLLSVLTRAVIPDVGGRIGIWAPLAAQVLVAATLAIASGPRLQHPPPYMRRPGLAVTATLVGVGAMAVFVWLAPHGAVGPLRPELSGEPHPFAEPLVASIELGTAALFAVAAARFALVSEERRDPFLGSLGAGSVLGATASLNYALFPTLNPGWLFTGDLFRAAAVTAWALGAMGEIVSYWSEIGRLAQAVERRRLARDLHDGLAQDLAFLVSHALAPADERRDPEWLERLGGAAQRALAESRRAIAALVAEASLPLDADLERTAVDIAARTGAHVDLDVADWAMESHQQEMIVRIVREAVTNATRHGQAGHIRVQLTDTGQRVLRVCDDGVGFNPDAIVARDAGFGLVSMRERAEALGATFAIRSEVGHGTTVEIAWP